MNQLAAKDDAPWEGNEMLRFVQADLFTSPAQTLVNTVNIVGAMGKGIAKQFKTHYPEMYAEYRHYCESGELQIGTLHVWRGIDRWVLNFPTKSTWRKPSKIEYIEEGLRTFRDNYTRLGIRSISFPPLGCGNGELDWNEVKPLMVQYLHQLDIPVWVHELFYNRTFQAEQKEIRAKLPPATFEEFISDFRSNIVERGGRFRHWVTGRPFRAEMGASSELHVYVADKLVLDEDYLAIAWVGLRLGVLTPEYFGSGEASPGGYIMPILAEMPYVRALRFGPGVGQEAQQAPGLLFNQTVESFKPRSAAHPLRHDANFP
jgi:O-acetyl-ADP-ribose deacetylase (regulator of RNase III)